MRQGSKKKTKRKRESRILAPQESNGTKDVPSRSVLQNAAKLRIVASIVTALPARVSESLSVSRWSAASVTAILPSLCCPGSRPMAAVASVTRMHPAETAVGDEGEEKGLRGKRGWGEGEGERESGKGKEGCRRKRAWL